ncbi:MAG: ribonuclease domain-containing protein [Acutalibacteraceae bacterium]
MKKTASLLLILLLLIGTVFSLAGCDELKDLAGEIKDEIQSELDWDGDDSSSDTDSDYDSTESTTSTESTYTDSWDVDSNIYGIDENGTYTSKDDVARYIYVYNKLPSNFITKKEAQALGWSGGSLEKYAPGKCIGGDRFGNYEGVLPKKLGRSYTECDIDTLGASSRGAKRIVFSSDGLIYYTDDHYETFTLLYGEE